MLSSIVPLSWYICMDLCGAAGNCHSGEIEESKIFHFFPPLNHEFNSIHVSLNYIPGWQARISREFLILCALLLYPNI